MRAIDEWTSVRESLPPANKPVLTFDKYGYYGIGWMCNDKSWDSETQCAYDVRYWMDLPNTLRGRRVAY